MTVSILTGGLDICAEFPPYYKSLSRRLYKVLDDVGASTVVRDNNVKMMTTQENIYSVLVNLPRIDESYRRTSRINLQDSTYVFGSSFEGTRTPGLRSDVDLVYVPESIPVVTNVSQSEQYESCFLLIQDNRTQPGYAKLQWVSFGVPQTRSLFNMLSSDHVDTENRLLWILPDETRVPGTVLHGPASTIEETDYFRSSDLVPALRCKTWPVCALEWLTRLRRYNYPTQDQINKCKELGFFLVYIGHPYSQEKHLQWRISFSLQERLLVINFNAVQLKCYILAKMIKKEIIHKSLGEKSLSSYHFKTLMFYMIEETPAEFWVEHNLLYCLHHILKRMLIMVGRGVCPNYFIPGENMFEGRISEQMQFKLCGLLRRLIDAKFKYLVTIVTDNLGDRYQEALVSGVQAYRFPSVGDFHCKISMHGSAADIFRCRTLLLCCDAENKPTNAAAQGLYDLKVRLLLSERVTDHSVEEVRRAVSLLLPYVDIQLMSVLVVLAKRRSRSIAFIFSLLTSEKWHALSLESDMFSSKLKQASLLCMLEYYEMSLEILDTLENQMRQSVSACYCSDERLPVGLQEGLQLLPLPICSYEDFLHRHVIPCVVFLSAERLLTPTALCYEMNRSAGSPPDSNEVWYSSAVVDGKVLLYYLLYLNHSRLGMDANASADVDNILWLLTLDATLGHRETALNLLGWMFKERGIVDRAVQCFRESLAIKPSHNAAFLHLRDIYRNGTFSC